MKCASEPLLLKYLADRLPSEQLRQIEQHLEHCTRCQQHVERLANDEPMRRQLGLDQATPPATDSARLAELHELLYELTPVRAGGPTADSRLGDSSRGDLSEDDAELDSAARFVQDRLQQLGRFRILRRLGAGGFGIVYLAEDSVLHRQVALKLPNTPALADPELRRRFLLEGRAAARLQHPHILSILEAGSVDGFCYLAAAYCSGPSLAGWLTEQAGPVPPATATRVALCLADAVEHAHQNGILHRDIKPSNVLLDPSIASPGLPFTPKLADFGLAKLMDSEAAATVSGATLGTPGYMAPEQASGRHDRIGPATDVYALGAVLYELLSGKAAIQGDGTADTLRRVLTEHPLPLRKLVPDVPRDLEAICLKCLEKTASQRYGTAAELAADLQRFLAGEPTRVRRLSPPEALWRWAKRRPTAATLTTAVTMATLLLVAGLAIHNSRLSRLNREVDRALDQALVAQRAAEENQRRVQQLLDAADLRLAGAAFHDGDPKQIVNLLGELTPSDGSPTSLSFPWRYLWRAAHGKPSLVARLGVPLYHLRYSPDSRWLACTGADSIVRLFDADTLQLTLSLDTQQREVNHVAFTPDSRTLVSAGDDGTLRFWDLADGTHRHTISAHEGSVFGVSFTPDGTLLASCGADRAVRLWEARNGAALGSLEGHAGQVEAIAISADGSLLGSVGNDSRAIVWELKTRTVRQQLGNHAGRVTSVAFSPNSRYVATSTATGSVQVADVAGGAPVFAVALQDGVQTVTFSPSGSHLVVGDRGGVVRLWPTGANGAPAADAPQASRPWYAHQGRVYSALFSPDGQTLLTAGQDGRLLAWRDWGSGERRIDRMTEHGISDFVFLPDGRSLLAVEPGCRPTLWRIDPRSRVGELAGKALHWERIIICPQGKLAAGGSMHGEIVVWDLESRQRLAEWQVGKGIVYRLRFAPDGQRLAVMAAEQGDKLWIFDVRDGRQRGTLPVVDGYDIQYSPHGELLAITSQNDILLRDARTLAPRGVLSGHGSTVRKITFLDHIRLASVSSDRTIKLWDVRRGTEQRTLDAHRSAVHHMALSPDGQTLVTSDESRVLKLWDVTTGTHLFELPLLPDIPSNLAFSPDGRRLAAIERGNIVFFEAGE